MLRTLLPQEPELVRLCRAKQWVLVSSRLRSNPFEAMPSKSALRGEGTTVLSVAVRCGAPKMVIQSLLDADHHQIGIIHHKRGTILHEALKHRVTDDVLDYLLRSVINYQRKNVTIIINNHHAKETCIYDSSLIRSSGAENAFNSASAANLLGIQDDLGRTALHYMVERVKRTLEYGDRSMYSWHIYKCLLEAHPESIEVMDSDGNTPLILLLLLPRLPLSSETANIEAEAFRMVELMVSTCPLVATISRKLPRPWRFLHNANTYRNAHGTLGDGAPTPLYYAILHGRSMETIHVLLNANRAMGIDACSTIISPYHEVPLHVAITTRSSVRLLSALLMYCPQSTIVSDVYGLTSVDWMWIRHVLDWHSVGSATNLVSRGRFLAKNFVDWHKDVTRRLWTSSENSYCNDHSAALDQMHPEDDRQRNIDAETVKRVKEDLIEQMQVLLPTIAAVMSPNRYDTNIDDSEPWSLLHAACFVPCPLAMVHLAISHSDSYNTIRTRDLRNGRLPLHYACTRLGYTANFPVGISRGIQRLTETSAIPELVHCFPEGCCVLDNQGQLPLHVVIDASKRYRATVTSSSSASLIMNVSVSEKRRLLDVPEVNAMEDEALHVLVADYPSSIEQKDGKTQLYPFQQAAVGNGTRLNTIYSLLRQSPTLALPEQEESLSMNIDEYL